MTHSRFYQKKCAKSNKFINSDYRNKRVTGCVPMLSYNTLYRYINSEYSNKRGTGIVHMLSYNALYRYINSEYSN